MILAPMSHVGWARASSTATSASSSRVRPRNGPPLAVSTSRATSPRAPPRSAWYNAECSESTGTISPPPRWRAARTTGPPAMRLSLFARASRFPDSSAAMVAGKPANPTTALRTTSTSSSAASSARAPGSSRPDRARSAATSNSAACASRSAVLRPAAERDDLPLARMALLVTAHDVERLRADGPCRPEDRDALVTHHSRSRRLRRRALRARRRPSWSPSQATAPASLAASRDTRLARRSLTP